MPSNGKAFGKYEGAFELYKRSLSYISGFLACFERQPQKKGLYADSHELQKGNDDHEKTENERIPIIRRLVEAVFGLLGGLSLSFLSWSNLYNNRRVFGAALLGCGWLLGGLEFAVVVVD